MRRSCALLLSLLFLPHPARGQVPPITACTAAIEGAVACMADRLCLCRFDPGGTLSGRPPRHRWDCGILRPHCGGLLPPAMPQPWAAGPGQVFPQIILPPEPPPPPAYRPVPWR